MRQIIPEIEPGSYWICKSKFSLGISSQDIFAKVLHVKEDKIYFMRKTCYGFSDLSPNSLKVDEFLEYYMRLE